MSIKCKINAQHSLYTVQNIEKLSKTLLPTFKRTSSLVFTGMSLLSSGSSSTALSIENREVEEDDEDDEEEDDDSDSLQGIT